MDLSGRVALVTGGAGGLGRACARALLDLGATVVLADRPGERLDEAAAELRAFGRAETRPVDLADPSTCSALPAAASSTAGRDRLDILVNAVGIMRTQPMARTTAEQWRDTFAVNLDGIFLTVQAAAAMMAGTGGSIVTLASVAARSGRPNAVDYAASKAGLLSLTKSAALAYAPRVRVNAVCPGVFRTDMWKTIIHERDTEFGAGAGEAYLDEVVERTPLRRLGDPAELGSVVAFLAGDLSSFVTGQAINVDGGLEMD